RRGRCRAVVVGPAAGRDGHRRGRGAGHRPAVLPRRGPRGSEELGGRAGIGAGAAARPPPVAVLALPALAGPPYVVGAGSVLEPRRPARRDRGSPWLIDSSPRAHPRPSRPPRTRGDSRGTYGSWRSPSWPHWWPAAGS